MANAYDIARYFLKLAASEPEPELVSHMRLQKLLYYAQGWSLAGTGQPLFPDKIEAWTHGPVVRSVYPKFADYGNRAIDFSHASEGDALTHDEQAIVRSVWEGYRKYSASELRRMTHAELPWRDARGALSPDESSDGEISADLMCRFFREIATQQAPTGLGWEPMEESRRDFEIGRTVTLDELRGRLRDAG